MSDPYDDLLRTAKEIPGPTDPQAAWDLWAGRLRKAQAEYKAKMAAIEANKCSGGGPPDIIEEEMAQDQEDKAREKRLSKSIAATMKSIYAKENEPWKRSELRSTMYRYRVTRLG